MNPNPVLKRLGFADSDRLVIIHTDDIGMCQASVSAFADLWDFGLISSGAVMTPCPWFPSAATYCRQHPEVDMGVHLTLNCEWSAYRWGPVSTRQPSSGLLDSEGYMFRSREEAQVSANPQAAQAELAAQVSIALQAGIDITHIDTHMGTVAHPKFIGAYVQLALQHCVPAMIVRLDQAGYQALGMDAETAALAAQMTGQMEAQGLPLIDQIATIHLDEPDNRMEKAQSVLAGLPAGITHFIIHPSVDTPELRAITPDWRCRVLDYEIFSSAAMRSFLKNSGLQIIGYHHLHDIMEK